MKLLRKSGLPLYHQLREYLREMIESGQWPPGYRLPTESEFVATYSCSRATVRQALQRLEDEGLVERIQGRGTFVAQPKVAQDLASIISLFSALPEGSRWETRLLTLDRVRATTSVSLRLGLPENAWVYELRRVFIIDGIPLMIVSSWLPVEPFPDLEKTTIGSKSLSLTLKEFYGIERIHQHKELEVTILDEDDAVLLEANQGAPALLVTVFNRLQDGSPLELRKMVVRGDRCKYYIDVDVPEI